MTQTTDPTIEELRTRLAELPCLAKGCVNGLIQTRCDCSGVEDTHLAQHTDCQGTGRALPWASKECGCVGQARCNGKFETPFRGSVNCRSYMHSRMIGKCCPNKRCNGTIQAISDHKTCNGSGRVPKALTSDDLWEHGITRIFKDPATGNYRAIHGWSLIKPPVGVGETPTLAALRAVAAQAGMR